VVVDLAAVLIACQQEPAAPDAVRASSFSASKRPYKKEWPSALAWEYLTQHSGKRFDSACVDAFRRAEAEVAETRASFPDHHQSKQASPAALGVSA